MITLEICLKRLRANIAALKSRTNAGIFAVVKANGYGHGIKIANYIEGDVLGFAVSCAFEAEQLIKMNIKKPILIMSQSEPMGYRNVIHTITSLKSLSAFKNKAICHCGVQSCAKNGIGVGAEKIKIALKVNTGMNRLGIDLKDFARVFERVIQQNNLSLTDIFTHLSSVDYASTQLQNLMSAIKKTSCFIGLAERRVGDKYNDSNKLWINGRKLRTGKSMYEHGSTVSRPRIHACASNFLHLDSAFHLDAVRCGLSIYGYAEGVKPILSAYTSVAQVNKVKRGERIGYGAFCAPHDMQIAVLMAGYADGFHRGVVGSGGSANRRVIINNKECRLIGEICMDMCMADVTNYSVFPGDKAYLINDKITALDLANELDTVVYEVLTSFSSGRIKRIYTE